MRYRGLLMVGVVAAIGCESVDSTNIDTAGIYAELSVTATGDGTSLVDATLLLGQGSANFLDLEGGDKISAWMILPGSDSSMIANMAESHFGGATWYTATFQTQGEDTEFGVNLDRSSSGHVSAPESYVTLPAPFVLSTASGAASFSRADTEEFLVQWDPFAFAAGDVMTYEVTGSCIQTSTGGVGSADSLQLAQGFLLPYTNRESDSCPVTVTLQLTRSGVVDPAYGKGGYFRGIQERSMTLQCLP